MLEAAREVNRRMGAKGDLARIRYISIDYVWEDDRWLVTISWEMPDDFFPEEDTIEDTLARWPSKELDRYRSEFDEALAATNTSQELSTLSLFSSQTELREIGATRGWQVPA